MSRLKFKRRLDELGVANTLSPSTVFAVPPALGSTTPAAVSATTATISGALDHDGSTVGFYGVTPVARPAAYTQTAYSTTTRTQSVPAQSAVATTGATDTAPFGYANAAQANDIVTQLNNARNDILNLKQLINSIIDDHQILGLAQ